MKYVIRGAFAEIVGDHDCDCYDHCDSHPCNNPGKQSANLVYSGPNLPCTGIQTCDDLSVVIQKIDEQLCILQEALFHYTNTTTSTTTILS